MNVDNAISPNAPEYYRAAADYDGVVLKTRQSLSGLTSENLREWYLARCSEYFFSKATWLCLAKRCKTSPSSSAIYRAKMTKLAFRLTSRLYVIRKMRKINSELDEFYDTFLKGLEGAHNAGYKRSIDKSLYLASRLKWATEHVLYETDILESARLGSIWLTRMNFNPTVDSKYCPWQFGDAMAHAYHFRQVLFQFDQSIQHLTEITTSTSQSSLAILSPSVQPDEVRKLLEKMGMGSIYNKSGEWAAALRALFVAGLVKGNGREVARWAINEQYVEQRSLETIRKAWDGDGLSQAEQFRNNEQRTAFRIVLDGARKLLKDNKLKGK